MGTRLLNKFLFGGLNSFDPEGGGSGPGDNLNVSLGADDASDDLSDDDILDKSDKDGDNDGDKPDEDDKEDKSEEDTEDNLDGEGEEDLDSNEDEEGLDTKDSSGLSVNRKAIEKKYPGLFKEFPELKAAIYREKAFVELFPTVEAAKVAENKAHILDAVDEQVSNGNIEAILQGLAKDNKPALEEIAHSFLGQLEELDDKLYISVLQTPFKQLSRWLYGEGAKHGNKNLQNAAILVHRALFNSDKLDEELPGREKPKVDPERERLAKERKEFEQTKYRSAYKEVSSRIERSMTKFIREKLDPSLGDWTINKIVKDTIEDVYSKTASDTRFKSQFDAVWKKAMQEGYSDESKARLISTFLARAKTLIPSIRRQVLLNATGKGNNSSNGQRKVLRPQSSGTSGVNKTGKGVSIKEAKSKGMTDAQLLGVE